MSMVVNDGRIWRVPIACPSALTEALLGSSPEAAAGVSADTDLHLPRVHQRLGGVDIQTFADGTVEIRWRRAYGERLSDEGFVSAASLLQAVLQHEDAADAAYVAEEAE
jgi:hypothetical protein